MGASTDPAVLRLKAEDAGWRCGAGSLGLMGPDEPDMADPGRGRGLGEGGARRGT